MKAKRIAEYLKEAQSWLAEAQHGDPNGGKAYQASKFVGYALQELETRETEQRCDYCGSTKHHLNEKGGVVPNEEEK